MKCPTSAHIHLRRICPYSEWLTSGSPRCTREAVQPHPRGSVPPCMWPTEYVLPSSFIAQECHSMWHAINLLITIGTAIVWSGRSTWIGARFDELCKLSDQDTVALVELVLYFKLIPTTPRKQLLDQGAIIWNALFYYVFIWERSLFLCCAVLIPMIFF